MSIFVKYSLVFSILYTTLLSALHTASVKQITIKNIEYTGRVQFASQIRDCTLLTNECQLASAISNSDSSACENVAVQCHNAALKDLNKLLNVLGIKDADVQVPVPPVPARANPTPQTSPITYRNL